MLFVLLVMMIDIGRNRFVDDDGNKMRGWIWKRGFDDD